MDTLFGSSLSGMMFFYWPDEKRRQVDAEGDTSLICSFEYIYLKQYIYIFIFVYIFISYKVIHIYIYIYKVTFNAPIPAGVGHP